METETFEQEFRALEQKSNSVRDLITTQHSGKVDNIQQVIDEINELISERETLRNELLFACDKISSRINGVLMRLTDDQVKEQITLHEKSVAVDQMKVMERLNAWRDVALLKKELRERLHELREQEAVNTSYDDILNG